MNILPSHTGIKKSSKGFDIDLQAEVDGEMKTIHTVRCSSAKEQSEMAKGLGDWAARIDQNARSKI